jgi:thiol-disulfide isomerase/thioredoxin
MKKSIIIFNLIVLSIYAFGQDKHILGLPIPHYKILKADSTYTSWTALNTNKPVMVIYFAPDCSHCQHLATELAPRLDELKGIQIVMISSTRTEYPYLSMIKDFSHDYALAGHSNIIIGTDYPNYLVRTYYNVLSTPFIAIYDKNGKMTQYFDKPAKIEDIIAAVKKL